MDENSAQPEIAKDAMTEAELLKAAEEIYGGWYADSRIDWEDFLYRLEKQTEYELGNSMDSPLIRRIKAHIREYRKS